jgi:hypothetical protein
MTIKNSGRNWKRYVVVGAMSTMVFIGSAQPVFAADNFFQKIQNSVSSTVDGFYLRYVPGKKPGKLVIKQMVEASKKLKSFESDTTIDVQLMGEGQQIGTAQLKAAGPVIVTEYWNPMTYKQDLKMSGSVSFEGTALSANAEVKMIDGITYAKFNQLPTLPGFSFDQIKNIWMKFDPAAQGVTKEETTFTAEEQQKLQEAFNKMIEASQFSEARSEKKDDVNTYVVDITIPKSAVIDYMMVAGEIERQKMINKAESEDLKAMYENVSPAEMRANYEKMMESVGEIKATVWVERKNYYPKHFEIPLEIRLTDAIVPQVGQADSIQLKINSSTSKFNESFTIEAPADAKDAQEVLMQMSGPTGPTMIMGTPTGVGTGVSGTQQNMYMPNVGTSELPEMTEWQKMQLEQYQKQVEEMEKRN